MHCPQSVGPRVAPHDALPRSISSRPARNGHSIKIARYPHLMRAMVATRSMARGSQGRARGLGVEARAASIVASPRPPLSRPRTAVRRFAPAWTTHSSRTSRGPERERSASSSGRVGVCMAAAPWPASVVTAVNMCVPLSFNSLSLSLEQPAAHLTTHVRADITTSSSSSSTRSSLFAGTPEPFTFSF